jgi:DNA invertase Pin-like site-specific DNA recombinase
MASPSLAQMERELILERTRAGLEAARKLFASVTPPHEVAHSLGVSVPTLYRWVPASSQT